SRRRHTRSKRDWSSDVCSSDLPSWRDDDQPTESPRTEVSLIYYPNKNGLVDRVFRIKTERSSASTPEPRTSHNLSNIEVLNQDGDEAEVRYNFLTMNHRYRETDSFFGTTYVTLSKASGEIKITKKKIVLKNDYIRQVIDVYHIYSSRECTMSSYKIALNVVDGVTRLSDCAPFETVLDAAYQAEINLPMDCSDGVCER